MGRFLTVPIAPSCLQHNHPPRGVLIKPRAYSRGVSRIIPKTFPGKQGPRTYYYEVEDIWDPQKKQSRRKVLRYLGKSRFPPLDPIPLPSVQMALLATQLATGACTAEDVFRFVQGMGVELPPTPLQALDIRYDLEKKRSELRLYPSMPSDRPRSRVGKPRTSPPPTRRRYSPLKGKGP